MRQFGGYAQMGRRRQDGCQIELIGEVSRQPTALQFRQLGLGYCSARSGAVSAMKIPGQPTILALGPFLWGLSVALCHHAESGKLGDGKF